MQGSTSEEWQAARAAASSLGEGGSALEEPLGRASSCLVMDYVPGPAFVDAQEPFLEHNAHRTAADLARPVLPPSCSVASRKRCPMHPEQDSLQMGA